MDFLRLEIITHKERNAALTDVKNAISSASGWIVSHNLYANTMASLNFEIPHTARDKFLQDLEKSGFTPNIIQDCPAKSSGEISGGVSLIFVHEEPDMKRDVPPFG